MTGAALMFGQAWLPWQLLLMAGLYSLGAHGIMTLNDFKAIEGDARMGVRSLPVQLGPDRAAWVASIVMIIPQLVVIALLAMWDRPYHAMAIAVLLVAQAGIMRWFVQEPIKRALYLSAFGVPFYVSGMMITAFALRAIVSGAL